MMDPLLLELGELDMLWHWVMEQYPIHETLHPHSCERRC